MFFVLSLQQIKKCAFLYMSIGYPGGRVSRDEKNVTVLRPCPRLQDAVSWCVCGPALGLPCCSLHALLLCPPDRKSVV